MFIFSADITKERVFFLVLVYVFNFDLHVFEFSAAMLEKGLFDST